MKLIKISKIIRASSDKVYDFVGDPANATSLTTPNLFNALKRLVAVKSSGHMTTAELQADFGMGYDPLMAILSEIHALRGSNPAFQTASAFMSMHDPYLGAIAGGWTPNTTIAASLASDMATIAGGYSSTQTIQRPMFDSIYNGIKGKMSAAATNAHKPTLASAIAANALFNPDALAREKVLGTRTGLMTQYADKIIDEIMRKSYMTGREAQNIERIKSVFMGQWGGGGAAQVQDAKAKDLAKNKELEKRNNPFYTPVAGAPSLEEEFKINDSDAQWINPSFLASMVVFFSEYWKKFKVLPP